MPKERIIIPAGGAETATVSELEELWEASVSQKKRRLQTSPTTNVPWENYRLEDAKGLNSHF